MTGKPIKHGKGWRIRWWNAKGVRQSETLHCDYRTACLALAQRESKAEEERRGLRAPAIVPKAFDELCDYYLSHHSVEKRNSRADHTNINLHLRPHFGTLKLHEIGEPSLAQYRLSKRALSPKTVHNQLTLLGTMLRVAGDNGWIAKLPKIRKPKLVLLDKDFRYLKSREEITRFLTAARQVDPQAYCLYATALFTGMRAGELAGLRRSDINFERNLITVARSYSGPTKNGETRHVPLLNTLKPILRAWLATHPFDPVFISEAGTPLFESARIYQEKLHKTLELAGFPSEVRNGETRRYIVFHDLRHTFASHYMMLGGEIWKLKKILGHKSIQMTERYSHLSPDAFADDLDRFGTFAPLSIGNQEIGQNKSAFSLPKKKSKPVINVQEEPQGPLVQEEKWKEMTNY